MRIVVAAVSAGVLLVPEGSVGSVTAASSVCSFVPACSVAGVSAETPSVSRVFAGYAVAASG
ncbi:MAG: hypothetical protein ACLSG5_06940, partial [Oscillospiraceae bacterium]